jgi:hypothetical protein
LYGGIWIGDVAQTAITSFKDADRVLQFGTSEYRLGDAFVRSFPWEANKIVIEDAASYATTFEDGYIVPADAAAAPISELPRCCVL